MIDEGDVKKNACALIVPSLVAGGLERVASELANFLSEKKGMDVYIICLADKEPFYKLADNVHVVKPGSQRRFALNRALGLITYLRQALRNIRPVFVLSFGSKFNSFTLLSTIGMGARVFVSDRSNPYRNSTFRLRADPYVVHDGIIHIISKWILYRRATGIVAQTEKAKAIDSRFLKHGNIKAIPNPVKEVESGMNRVREKIILNVGRFTELKNQAFLVRAFHEIGDYSWQLVFVGSGPYQSSVRELVSNLGVSDHVEFIDETRDIDSFYRTASIFAFVSLSEGFPNALAEAMGTPVASIAFDCVSGPSDLISHGDDGMLIELGDSQGYIDCLKKLMTDKKLRAQLEAAALLKMKRFRPDLVCEQYYEFLIGGACE